MATTLPSSAGNTPLWATTISGPQPTTGITALPMTGSPSGAHSAPKKIYQKKAALMMRNLIGSGIKVEEAPPNVLYVKLDSDLAIEAMTKFRPVHSGRPKFETMLFLNAATAPQKATSGTAAYLYRLGAEVGLFMAHPPIPGKRKRSYRLTLTGLKVLDHWAEKNPSFTPFLNAFVTKKARNEIALEAMDFYMGQVPASIQKDLADIDAWAKAMAKKFTEEESRKAEAAVKGRMSQLLGKFRETALKWPTFKSPEVTTLEQQHRDAYEMVLRNQMLLQQANVFSNAPSPLTAQSVYNSSKIGGV